MEEESPQYQTEIRQLESDVIDLIVPSDKDDGNNVVLEVRSATGGKEAAIFASEVFSMYIKFCSFKQWKFDLLTMGENIEGGLKDATASISGKNVFGVLKVQHFFLIYYFNKQFIDYFRLRFYCFFTITILLFLYYLRLIY